MSLPDPAADKRPPGVSRALTLLWFSWFLSFPLWALGAERQPVADDGIAWTFNLAILAWIAWLNRRTGQGSNPARWCLLGLSLLGWYLQLNPPDDEIPPGLLETCLTAADTVITVWALWLLFTGAGGAWFAGRRDRGPVTPPR